MKNLELRYRMLLNKQKRASVLPIEYQRVDYIESTGKQYIDTEYIPTKNTKVDLELSFNGEYFPSATNTVLFGATEGTTIFQVNRAAAHYMPDYLYTWVDRTYESGAKIYSQNGLNDIFSNKNTLSVQSGFFKYANREMAIATKTTEHTTYTLLLFGANTNGVSTPYGACNMRVYSFKIYDNEQLIRDYIPCYRKSDDVAGLYDLVSDVFYTNAGTGKFNIGAEL